MPFAFCRPVPSIPVYSRRPKEARMKGDERPLLQRQYAAIGRVACQWAYIESMATIATSRRA